eukprot:m.115130 g.115130  ORF g.115130 m.115130 type:complete len:170 (+) comp17137_c0_seq4:1097-1606(+)
MASNHLCLFVLHDSFLAIMHQFQRPSCILQVRCSAPRPLPEPTLGGDLACDADVTGDTTDANNTLGDAAPDVWFAFTAPDSGSYTFRTCGSNFDTTIAVYDRTVLSGTVPSASNARATLGPMVTECDDCGECDENEILHAILLPGTYWIVVDGFNSESGRYVECQWKHH